MGTYLAEDAGELTLCLSSPDPSSHLLITHLKFQILVIPAPSILLTPRVALGEAGLASECSRYLQTIYRTY